MKKKIFGVVFAVLMCLFLVFPCYAAPVQDYGYSLLPNYDMASIQLMAQAIDAQWKLSAPFTSYTQAKYSTLLFVVRRNRADSPDACYYRAYVAYSSGPVSCTNIPEEWGVAGAVVHLSGGVTRVDCYTFVPDYERGLIFVPSNVFSGGTQSITLPSSGWVEQICYMYSGVGIGLNEQYVYGTGSMPVLGAQSWIDALDAYDNGRSPGYTEEQYQEAVQNGYNSGYSAGYDTGYSIGNEKGYSAGYDIGESAGYAEGQRDGSAVVDIPGVIDSYFAGARTLFESWFDYTIFGVNIMGLLAGLIVVAIVFFVLKKVK